MSLDEQLQESSVMNSVSSTEENLEIPNCQMISLSVLTVESVLCDSEIWTVMERKENILMATTPERCLWLFMWSCSSTWQAKTYMKTSQK